jgi:hypothetical protein
MSRLLSVRRLGAVAIAGVLAASTLSGCSTDAQRSKVFITRASKVVLEPAPHHKGETIFRIENDDAAKHRVVLLKLDNGVSPVSLPVVSGLVPIGKAGDLEFRGHGYRVVEKLETMRAFYGGDNRVVTTLHTYLGNGTYVLMSDLNGDFGRGVWAQFTIGVPA